MHDRLRAPDAALGGRPVRAPLRRRAATPSRPEGRPEHARRERGNWYLHLFAFAVGSALLLGGAAMVGDGGSDALLGWIPRWAWVLAIDVVWSFSYTVFPRKQPAP